MGTPDNLPSEPQAASKIQGLWLKWRLFIAGFLGWFLFAGLFWFLLIELSSSNPNLMVSINIVWFIFTIVVMLFFALNKSTRMFSLGILAAIAVNLFISIALGMTYDAICFKPFFVPW